MRNIQNINIFDPKLQTQIIKQAELPENVKQYINKVVEAYDVSKAVGFWDFANKR